VRVFQSGLRKLIQRPASFVSLGLLIALLLLVFVAVGATADQLQGQQGGAEALLLVTFPGSYELVLGFTLGLGGLLAVIYGAAIAGSEWSWGTLKSAVARGEGRSWYVLCTFAAIAVMLALGLVIAYLVGVAGAYLGALLANVPTDGVDDFETLRSLPEAVARTWLALAEQAAIGFAVATLARSQVAGIGVGIAAYFGEQFASIFVSDITKWLPFSAANASVTVGPQTSVGGELLPTLDPNTALLVVLLWLSGALVAAALFTERAEIGG
jgi:hypothetical protein